MKRPVKHSAVVLKAVAIFVLIRIVFGLLLMGVQKSSPEGAMLVLVDVPTLGLYWLLSAAAGIHLDIVDAFDMRFFFLALLVWAMLGAVIGIVRLRWVLRTSGRTAPAK